MNSNKDTPSYNTIEDTGLDNSLDNFFKRSFNVIESSTGDLPIIEYDADWASPCHKGKPFLSDAMIHSIHWQAQKRAENNDLSGLESALELSIHPDIKTFYTRYWSEQMEVMFVPIENPETKGNLTLMFVCNEADMERLIKNQIGHCLNKIRNKQTLTLFIACTDSDYIISIDNNSAQVVLERPGYAIEKILAPNLKTFIDQLDILTDDENNSESNSEGN